MAPSGHLCSVLLLLLGLRHCSGFWIVNVVFPPNVKPGVPRNSTPPLLIGESARLGFRIPVQ